MEVVLRTSAKVNLALEVLGKRGDGYHEIATVLQAVDLFDRLKLEAADTLSLHTDDPDLPTDDGNLVMRAARLLGKAAGSRPGPDPAGKAHPGGGRAGGGSRRGSDLWGPPAVAARWPKAGCRSWRWSWAWTCRSSSAPGARWPGGAASG
jgi:hypothetical protein